MAGRTGRKCLSRHQKERESQALQEQLDAAMGAATLALGVQEGSHTLNTGVAVIDTSTFTFVEQHSSRREIVVPVVTVSDKPLDHGTVTQMVIELV